MKYRYVGTGQEPRDNWAIIASLAAVEQLLLADGQPFHRDFAAMAIATPACGGRQGDYDKFISEGLLYEAWIGNMAAVSEANWDYLENAKHKAFTTWRTGIPNGTILMSERHFLTKKDSVWPGAMLSHVAVAATSALLPDEDDVISGIFCRTHASLLNAHEMAYADYRPGDDRDLVDGTNFGHPPILWW